MLTRPDPAPGLTPIPAVPGGASEMMALTNSATVRLEAYARARGLEGFGVVKSPQNAAGVFFASRLGGCVLTRWISLGRTVAEAKSIIDRLAVPDGE